MDDDYHSMRMFANIGQAALEIAGEQSSHTAIHIHRLDVLAIGRIGISSTNFVQQILATLVHLLHFIR